MIDGGNLRSLIFSRALGSPLVEVCPGTVAVPGFLGTFLPSLGFDTVLKYSNRPQTSRSHPARSEQLGREQADLGEGGEELLLQSPLPAQSHLVLGAALRALHLVQRLHLGA